MKSSILLSVISHRNQACRTRYQNRLDAIQSVEKTVPKTVLPWSRGFPNILAPLLNASFRVYSLQDPHHPIRTGGKVFLLVHCTWKIVQVSGALLPSRCSVFSV